MCVCVCVCCVSVCVSAQICRIHVMTFPHTDIYGTYDDIMVV